MASSTRPPRGAPRRAIGAPLALLGLAVVGPVALGGGCGNDFDALFPEAPPTRDGAPGGPEASTDGGGGGTAGDASDRLEAGEPPGCGPPVPTEDCTDDSDTEDKTSTNTCSGCGCGCGPFSCTQPGRDSSCATTCSGGSTCAATCSTEHGCTLESHSSSAKLTCTGKADRCELTCDEGGACEQDCQNDGSCTLKCAPGSTCLVRCLVRELGGKVKACNVDCQGGQKKDCPQGVFTCNRDCP